MADRLLCLRHDAVVGGNHQHGTIGHVGTAGPHLGEGLVARGVDKGDRLVVMPHRVGANMLRDATAFPGSHVHAQNPVEQGRLAMIDVAQKRHDRRPGNPQGRILVHGIEAEHEFLFEILGRLQIELHAQFRRQHLHRVAIEKRPHARHRLGAERQEFLEHFGCRQTDRLGEGAHRAGNLNGGVGFPRGGR